jgi:hypothetical protein
VKPGSGEYWECIWYPSTTGETAELAVTGGHTVLALPSVGEALFAEVSRTAFLHHLTKV